MARDAISFIRGIRSIRLLWSARLSPECLLIKEEYLIADSFFLDFHDRFSLRQVRAVDEPSDALAALRLAEVKTERRRVADDVAAHGARRVAEERVGLRVHLVRHRDGGVVEVAEAKDVVHEAVELALA